MERYEEARLEPVEVASCSCDECGGEIYGYRMEGLFDHPVCAECKAAAWYRDAMQEDLDFLCDTARKMYDLEAKLNEFNRNSYGGIARNTLRVCPQSVAHDLYGMPTVQLVGDDCLEKYATFTGSEIKPIEHPYIHFPSFVYDGVLFFVFHKDEEGAS